jgi:hypothetical protein
MDKAVLATLSFVAGAGFGFAVGYYLNKKEKTNDTQIVEPIYSDKPEQSEKEEPENSQKDIFEIKPARLARKPGDVGINYTEYTKELKYKQESQSPSEDDTYDTGEGDGEPEEDEIDESEFEETYEERIERESEEALEHSERYKRDHKGKIELMTQDDWDTDFPENDYEREDLYYFTDSDILTDEDGHQLDENEFIGPKVRQVGWMQSPDENIYVRNHPKEKEYRICKEHYSVEDWF